jgi:methyl-accepting chemotaxis protein
MIDKVNGLKLWMKLGLVAVLMGIPLTVLLVVFLRAKTAELATIRDEMDGLAYVTPFRSLLENVALHRDFSQRAINGDQSVKAAVQAVEPAIDSDLAALQRADDQFGKSYGTSETLSAVKSNWRDIRTRDLAVSAKESFDLHTKMIAGLADQMRIAGDNAIILDPKLETSYLGNTILVQLPGAAEALGQLRGFAGGLIVRGKITEEERNRIIAMAANVNRYVGRNGSIAIAMGAVFRKAPQLEAKLGPQMLAAAGAGEVFLQEVNAIVARGGQADGDPKEFFNTATNAIQSVFKLYEANGIVFRELLDARGEQIRSDIWLDAGIATLALFLALLMIYGITSGVAQQIASINKMFQGIGVGDLSARAEVYADDELGALAQSLNATFDNTASLIQSREERDRIQTSIQKLLEEIAGVADGDLTSEAEVTTEVTGAIADSFNYMIAELRGIIANVQQTTQAVTTSAISVQSTAEALAQGSESQSIQIVEASAAIDEMVESINQVSANAHTASLVAEAALRNARSGAESVRKTMAGMNGIRQQVQQTSKRIKRLGESSQEIGEIVQLIGDIADRTSILALNASIQASMAGEAGKGFAVVAEEVEHLSERSTEATKRIASLIKTIQSDTSEAIAAMEETTREVVGGSTLANEAGQKLNEIESVSVQLSDLIQSISTASTSQSRGSESIARSMSDISEVTQLTALGAKDAADSIRHLSGLAESLSGSMNHFKLPQV